MDEWQIGFRGEIWGFFAAVTCYYEGESDDEFMEPERQREAARSVLKGVSPDLRRRKLAGFSALLGSGAWDQYDWGTGDGFPFSQEPEFLHEVLEIIVAEIAATLPPDPLPKPLKVTVTSGGGVLPAPLDPA